MLALGDLLSLPRKLNTQRLSNLFADTLKKKQVSVQKKKIEIKNESVVFLKIVKKIF